MVDDLTLFPVEPFLDTVSNVTGDGTTRTLEQRTAIAMRKRETMLQKRANESARAILPNAAQTKLVWTVNLRALRYILALRGAPDADLEIRRFACALAIQCKVMAPATFADLELHAGDFGVGSTTVKYQKV
jgi:thymidylate synthase ThyX